MKIALLGYGVEGASAYRYYKQLYPDALFEVYDGAAVPKFDVPEGVVLHVNVNDFSDIDADIVVKVPAISPDRVGSRGTITSVTQEFFDVCKAPIIGVTGTKGKGTTATLIAVILKKAGVKTWLVGNIGLAALDAIEDINRVIAAGETGVVVYELSSFQLWDLKKSPHVAVVLMIEPEHLDVHRDFDEYKEAKRNIVAFQTKDDVVVYYADNETTAAIAQSSAAHKLPYGVAQGNVLSVDGKSIVARADIQLYGEHNIGNVQAALIAAWQYTHDTRAMAEAVREFRGLPHRLEEVGVVRGVLYINDSFSSAPPATLAAVKAFAQPKIVIMGGYDRGLDFSEIARAIAQQPRLKKVLLMGVARHRIADAFNACGCKDYEIIDGTMEYAVARAAEIAVTGDVVLLSPGCASFDMFRDFSQRGDMFRQLVAAL